MGRRARRQSRARNRLVLVSGAAAVVVVASAVGVFALSGGNEEAKTPTRAASTTTSSSTTTTVPIPTAPLTGLPDPQQVALSRSSLAVKIENTPEARPQSGLDVADIVYEEVVEGGITRFWAIFNSTAPQVVGPIRSVRSMDPGIVRTFGGVVAYSGGTEPNVALIRALPVAWVDENNAGDAFYRESDRPAPHNLFARTDQLFQRNGQPVPPPAHFTYLEDGQTFSGESIASFHVNFRSGYDTTWGWNTVLQKWARFQQTNEPFMAIGSTPEPVQVTADTVIVQFVPYNASGEGELFGAGDAWIFSNGQLIRAKWSRRYPDTPTAFVDAEGNPIPITPGRTWVELLPVGSTVDVVAGAPPSTTTTSAP
jgi:hypothetical protein